MIKIVINGTPFENFTSATVERSIEQFSGSFTFTATQVENENNVNWDLQAGSSCVITVNDFAVITGFIDSITPSTDPRSHDVTITGRDITGDVVDSTLLASDVEMKPPVTLPEVIKKVLGSLGLDLPVTDTANTPPFTSTDFVACEEGANAWQFIDDNARKKQVLVNTNGKGGVVCMRSDSAINKGLKLTMIDIDLDSNILKSSSSVDFSQRFGQYVVTSQSNLATQQNQFAGLSQPQTNTAPELLRVSPTAQNQTTAKQQTSGAVTVRSGVVVDKQIRQSKRMVIVAEQTSSTSDALARAKWQANMNKARSITYSATIDGFVHTDGEFKGQPYSFNELVVINDENQGINATMLTKSVRFTVDSSGGEITDFEFVDKDSYKLELSDPSLQDKKVNKVGTPFANLAGKVNAQGQPVAYVIPPYLKKPTA